jgi:hypothetical protein
LTRHAYGLPTTRGGESRSAGPLRRCV